MMIKIEYPHQIQARPNTEGLNPIVGMSVDMLPGFFETDIDKSIENVRNNYRSVKNDLFLDALGRIEQCLFRLYEAKYLVLPYCEADLLGFAFDDAYHDFVVQQVSAQLDAARGEQEYEQALAAVKEKDYSLAGTHFRQAALCGHIAAQYNYGVSLTSDEVAEADPLEGAFWYFMAAKGGEARAMVNLAIAYRSGTGVYPSAPMMMYWYAKAALIPFPYGVYNLGLCLQNEEYLSGNAVVGRHLKEAADQLEDPTVRAFAQKIASQVIDILQKKTFNI